MGRWVVPISVDRDGGARGVLKVLQGLEEQPALAEGLQQLRADAAIGRALRLAANATAQETLIHISWFNERTGRSDGEYLGDPTLARARADLAEAAQALLDHLAGIGVAVDPIDPSPGGSA